MAAALDLDPAAVAHDSLARLTTLVELLATWTQRINLIGPATLPDAWDRHIVESAALLPLIPADARRLADLGSGAGFPGLVLAILGAPDVHLVESDQRKAAFLREAARVTETPVTVHAHRIEALDPLAAHVVTARALAPLTDLLPMVTRHLAPEGTALLPKGRTADDELTACADRWIMRVTRRPAPDVSARASSSQAPAVAGGAGDGGGPGTILILREIRRVATDT
ncbi:16S rRNA (guanine(527)-N(7))-methyltransferase RsmG [Roseospira navarrensis]|uniref:Ribosomal RNA small subunit methyltransferase G n=1 Tax=Roseospira navarrensis TaxID=140058 RepID=A0A7X2D423_9PROT|nr:16S rRNA (guanine(527)-N(7))-methyltransferase RsmG [Roseospira navarrensis]